MRYTQMKKSTESNITFDCMKCVFTFLLTLLIDPKLYLGIKEHRLLIERLFTYNITLPIIWMLVCTQQNYKRGGKDKCKSEKSEVTYLHCLNRYAGRLDRLGNKKDG